MAPATYLSDTAEIFDIRQSNMKSSLNDEIQQGLAGGVGEKHLPTMLCYDEAGLKLFEDITYLDEYYLTNAEIEVLTQYADQLAERLQPNSMLLELGSGNLRKVQILLDAIERQQKNVAYYALDLSLSELERTLAQLPKKSYRHVTSRGLLGTFQDGLAWLQSGENTQIPKCIMFLGSSIGNLTRVEASSFLNSIAASLNPTDSMLVGIDNCQDALRVFSAYNDSKNVTREFYCNALRHASRLTGIDALQPSKWNIMGDYNVAEGRHEAFVSPKSDLRVGEALVQAGEKVHLEYSHKYSVTQQQRLFAAAGLQLRAEYVNKASDYSLSILSVPPVQFASDPKVFAKDPTPSLNDWRELWKAWDLVSRSMIPKDALLSKPINLRNCCLFYLGHIPTFLDIHLTRATKGQPTEPASYPQIFERGVDPDVENPELCHDHSEVPDQWPPLDEILAFTQKVRERTIELYGSGSVMGSRRLRRALWLSFEHEVMHLETLLYMLLQSEQMLPPPGPKPDFATMAEKAEAAAKPETWVTVPARKIVLGMEDADDESTNETFFGWDNEKPVRETQVHSFQAASHAITNGDYAHYLEACGITKYPASWGTARVSDGATQSFELLNVSSAFIEGKTVKTVFGPVPLAYALDWPVMASYDELAGYAKWKNGRIPTLEEARSIYAYVETLDLTLASNVARTIPAVNGHLSNGGVEETPPSSAALPSAPSTTEPTNGPDPASLFADLQGSNVGFKAFHPMPVSLMNGGSDKLAGLSGLGGVWEWTSSVLERHDGFEAMDLYPGYTADFFDTKHNIVLGGSWATHPRIAGRRSFVNWYQRNYPYAWTGARLVRDLPAQ